MATNNRRKRCDNSLVSINAQLLSGDERRKLANMFVKSGKIGGYARGREKSDVWKHFGILAYRDDETGSHGIPAIVTIDGNRHYCSSCLVKAQAIPDGRGHMRQVQSYLTSTSTCALTDHLKVAHDIEFKKVGNVISRYVGFFLILFGVLSLY